MKRLFFVILLFSILLLSYQYSWCAKIRNWYNTNYTTDIVSVNKNIVVGTTKGVVIYYVDSDSFVTLNNSNDILENQINGVTVASGNIWLYSPNGITIISEDTTTMRKISSSFFGIEGTPETGLLKGDTLFMGTNKYLYVWDTKGSPFSTPWSNHPYDLRGSCVNTIFIKNDTLFAGTDVGLCRIPIGDLSDTTAWLWNTTVDGLPDDTVSAVCFWENEYWVGTRNGIVSGNMNNWFSRDNGLWSKEINRFYSAGTLWVATENTPHYWNSVSNRWISLNRGLKNTHISGICGDATGKVWIGTDGDGIASLNDTLWSSLRLPGPSSNNFSDIVVDENGDIWGVHYGGFISESRGKTISHFHNDNWEILNDTNELQIPGTIRWVSIDHEGNKWFGIWSLGTEKDIIKLSANGEWDSLSLPVSGVVGTQFVDSKDNKWFSNFSNSVCKLSADDSTWKIYTDENHLAYIVALSEDSLGSIYFGSAQKGLSVLKTDGTWLKIGGLPSEEVFDLACDENNDMWVGTASGVAVVRNFQTVSVYTHTLSGLLGDNIMDICIDWRGNKWFEIENKGVSVLKNNGGWDSVTVNDGLASNFIIDDLDGLAFDKENGYLWIATRDGISRCETGTPEVSEDLSQIDVYPNPFIPKRNNYITFNRLPDNARIFIYSVSLRKIRTIENIEEATHRAFWDGKDEKGNLVDSGIYIYLIICKDGNKKTGKIAVVR